MSDLIERLRTNPNYLHWLCIAEAADEIERLQARVEELEGDAVLLNKIIDGYEKRLYGPEIIRSDREALATTEQEQRDHKGRPMTYWGGIDTEPEVSDV